MSHICYYIRGYFNLKKMKEAINYLKNLGLKCDINGNILSKITDGEDGIALIDMVEENTENEKDGYCYTIINSKLEKIDI